jgi:hypothetical protein
LLAGRAKRVVVAKKYTKETIGTWTDRAPGA